jgi:hypothetical protein
LPALPRLDCKIDQPLVIVPVAENPRQPARLRLPRHSRVKASHPYTTAGDGVRSCESDDPGSYHRDLELNHDHMRDSRGEGGIWVALPVMAGHHDIVGSQAGPPSVGACRLLVESRLGVSAWST